MMIDYDLSLHYGQDERLWTTGFGLTFTSSVFISSGPSFDIRQDSSFNDDCRVIRGGTSKITAATLSEYQFWRCVTIDFVITQYPC